MINISGIYQIKSNINNKIYIGSAININKRWALHKNDLIKNQHHSIYLQRHFNKYSLDDLEFTVLEICEIEDLILKEQFYFDTLKPEFNICKVANSSLGVKRRKETIEKLKKVHTGVKHPDWRNKLKSKSQGGENHWTKKKEKPFSKESKEKMSRSQKELYENGYQSPRKTKILQFDLNNNFIKEWSSIQEAINKYRKGINNNLSNKN